MVNSFQKCVLITWWLCREDGNISVNGNINGNTIKKVIVPENIMCYSSLKSLKILGPSLGTRFIHLCLRT